MKFPAQPPSAQTAIVEANGRQTAYFFTWLASLYAFLSATMGKGYSGTITTAKLTGGGTNGSITFVNGVVTAQTAAT